MSEMQAIAWEGPRRLRHVRRPRPQLEAPDDAIVRVSQASTCGTDLHAFRGSVPGFEPGTVLGHEFVGSVVEVGPGVRRHRAGERVYSCDFTACGDCGSCRAGWHPQCRSRRLFGFSGVQPLLDGGMAEYVRVPAADVTLAPLDAAADARLGLLAADVLPTAQGALHKAAPARGGRLAVIGAGPLGLLTALLARHAGFRPTLFENHAGRADRARTLGLDAAGGEHSQRGFDAAIDAVGGHTGLRAALDRVRGGGLVVGVGSQAGPCELDWGGLFQREISLHFVIGNAMARREPLSDLAPVLAPWLDVLFPDHLDLAAVPRYFEALDRRDGFKAVIQLEGAA